MGFMICLGTCIVCGRTFGFNPDKVPSIRIKNVKEPVCRDCVNRANPKRIEKGLEPIIPLPGAYEEAEC